MTPTTMNCPKCGFEQAESDDCVKCGVVISKYLALQIEPASRRGVKKARSAPAPAVEPAAPAATAFLLDQLGALEQRLGALESEQQARGRERTQSEARTSQLAELSAALAERLAALERRAAEAPRPKPSEEPSPLEQIVSRIELLEVWIGQRESRPRPAAAGIGGAQDPTPATGELRARVGELAARLDRVEAHAAALPEELEGKVAGSRELEEFVHELGTLEASVDALGDRLDGIAAEAGRAVLPAPDTLERYSARIGAVEGQLARLERAEAAVTALEGARDAAAHDRGQIDGLVRGAAELRAALERVDLRLASLEGSPPSQATERLDQLTAEIQVLHGLAGGGAAVERQVGQLRGAQNTLSKVLKSVRDEVAQLRGNPAETSGRMDQLAASVAALGERLDAGAARWAEVERTQGEMRRALDALPAGLAPGPAREGDPRVQDSPERLDELRGSLASLAGTEGGVTELRRAQAALSSALGAICSDLAQLKNASAETSPRLEQLAREIAELRVAELGPLERRCAELADRVEDLRERYAGVATKSAAAGSGPGVPRSEIEAMQQSLQAVSVRYSEIGELKRSQLALSNSLESLERGLAALRDASQRGSLSRVDDLEREVGALKAEVRRILAAG